MTTISKSLLNGLPIKKSRVQVFEILNQNPQGLSAVSIYAQIKNEHKITLGTIDLLRKSLLQVHPIYQCSD
ncbi:Fe2+/Zn2+ uptake regulation protein [Acinetobacter baumannii]|nr:hypothetical protein AM415_001726 [Acinetobacter baumannii]OOT23238.1 Fe2+/Zn2+ uptake regulation protein [Acinetobacter baumannii]OOU85288.1 Fe2+/Zn2+ uptake regulation protein [Acinetobacter baumannii]OTL97600.1 Fe2+/Zn2+ uptake regulation protein [Acinetobacter baumannii]OTU45226.1 Fe2+/Zn2+ uptake regulation protein [Acinetobacter baumannii]